MADNADMMGLYNIQTIMRGNVLVLLLLLGFAWPMVRVDAKTLLPADDDQRYYDIYLLDNRVCRQCKAYWYGADQVMLINRAGKSVVVKEMDVVGADTQPLKRRFLQAVLKGIDLPGRIIVPQWYDPMQEWKDSYREAPPPSPVNDPAGGASY